MIFATAIKNVITSYLPSLTSIQKRIKEQELKESTKIAIRIAIAVGEYFLLEKSWWLGHRLPEQLNLPPNQYMYIYPWAGSVSVFYGAVYLLGKFDSQSVHFALSALSARVAYYFYKHSDSNWKLPATAMFGIVSFVLCMTSNQKPYGLLKDLLD